MREMVMVRAIRARHSKAGLFGLVLLGVGSLASMCDCDGEGGQYW